MVKLINQENLESVLGQKLGENVPSESILPEATEKKERESVKKYIYQLLARREYSEQEIRHKLKKRDCAEDLAASVLREFVEESIVSNRRFAEMMLRSRQNKAFGPIKLRQELKSKGVESELINEVVDEGAEEWKQGALQAVSKKTNTLDSDDFKTKAKLSRYLQNRGFTHEQINYALGEIEI